MKQISRRAMLGTAATMVTTAAFAEGCPVGPPQHHKGPLVFMDYDQVELDASYDQVYYEPLIARVSQRLDSNSDATRARIGAPQRAAYGPTEIEKLDICRTSRPNAPVFVFIHGGNWRVGSAKQYGYPAEMFINAGAHYVALDFIAIKEANGDLGTMAAQVRRGIAWVYENAASFDGDPERIFIGGHSSGGHLCGVALVTDWHKDFRLPQNTVKGGLCMSGLYEMTPVRLSWRRTYVNFTDAMADAMSAQRYLEKLHAPMESPDFQRQSRDSRLRSKRWANRCRLSRQRTTIIWRWQSRSAIPMDQMVARRSR